ncbi:type II toxin-antitoxin system VapC family toxin [Runella sp.]|uniref:type II toxin-antitoxin system VapC family toxin n=1 Tax=Runella sp. TaxID=1960881 RepID=UPI003D09625A
MDAGECPLLSINVKNLISDISTDCFVSVISLFEMAIKKKIGKLTLSKEISEYANELQRIGITILPITPSHLGTYEQIPLISEHKDSFDRLIIATAFHERLAIITVDEKFNFYSNTVKIVW